MKLIAIAVLMTTFAQSNMPTVDEAPSTETAAICFKTGEQVSGMNKICFYDCMGSAKAITIGAVELCPLSIND